MGFMNALSEWAIYVGFLEGAPQLGFLPRFADYAIEIAHLTGLLR
jgi:hypothetical protein